MKFKPGQTGNPNGRPKKDRALTALIETSLSHTIEIDGERVSGKRLLARLVTEAATTGEATLPNGKVLRLAPKDWLDFVKWIYAHIDGPAPAKHEITGEDGGALVVKVVKGVTMDEL